MYIILYQTNIQTYGTCARDEVRLGEQVLSIHTKRSESKDIISVSQYMNSVRPSRSRSMAKNKVQWQPSPLWRSSHLSQICHRACVVEPSHLERTSMTSDAGGTASNTVRIIGIWQTAVRFYWRQTWSWYFLPEYYWRVRCFIGLSETAEHLKADNEIREVFYKSCFVDRTEPDTVIVISSILGRYT